MADIIIDGRVRVDEVEDIADISAPTLDELAMATRLDTIMTPDGLVGFEPDTADVDTGALSSTFDTVLPGRDSFSGTMIRAKKQEQAGDEVYDLMVKNYRTHIVVRTGIDADTAYADAQEVRVYPVACGQVRNLAPEANTVERYEVPTKIYQDPNLRATVTEESS